MRRRLFAPLLSVLVVAFLFVPAAALAAPGGDQLVLAADPGGGEDGEGGEDVPPVGEEGEAPGPEPAGPNETDNPAAPEDYEANFLWGAAVGLLALMVLGAVALAGLYWLLVVRPKRSDTARS